MNWRELSNDEREAALKDLPHLSRCDGGCGSFLKDDEGEAVGKVEVGHRMGVYAPVRMCAGCAKAHRAKKK